MFDERQARLQLLEERINLNARLLGRAGTEVRRRYFMDKISALEEEIRLLQNQTGPQRAWDKPAPPAAELQGPGQSG